MHLRKLQFGLNSLLDCTTCSAIAFGIWRAWPSWAEYVAVKRLIYSLESGSPATRIQATETLGSMGQRANRAVPALALALDDADLDVSWAAQQALGEIGPAALPWMIARLSHQDPCVRLSAAQILGSIGPDAAPSARILATMATEDEDHDVRASALDALGEIQPNDTSVIHVLARLLCSDDPKVRLYTTVVFQRIGPNARQALPELISRISDQDQNVRIGAARAIGEIGPAARLAIQDPSLAIHGEDALLRVFAAESLWKVAPDSDEIVAVLMQIVANGQEQSHVRRYAASALGTIGHGAFAAIPVLESCVDDETFETTDTSCWGVHTYNWASEALKRIVAQ